MATPLNNKVAQAQRLDKQRHEKPVKPDPAHFVTYAVKDPVKGFTITFDPRHLAKVREKYGDNLIEPLKP